MKKNLLYSSFFIIYSIVINAGEDSLFGGTSSSSSNTSSGNLFGSSTGNITFGQQTQTITLPKKQSVTAQSIAGFNTPNNQNQTTITQQAQNLELQNQTEGQQALALIQSQNSNVSLQQKSVALLTNHTSLSVTANDLTNNPVTAGAQQVTFKNKKKAPPALQYLSQKGTLSFTTIHNQAKPFIPNNGITSDSTLNQLYLNFINAIKSNPGFIPFFRKLHVVALHEIYNYLIGIYAGLNMTHIDDIETYITLESLYGLNKKTIIINHLINLIEAQLNQAIKALFPGIPEQTASHVGMTAMELDQGSNLDLFVVDIEQVILATFKKNGITPAQWNTVYTQLTNPDYESFFTTLNRNALQSALIKINHYCVVSMDLSTLPGTPSKTPYQATIANVYQQAPQTTYFNGSVPSGTTWQNEINRLFASKNNVNSDQIPCSVSLVKQLTTDERMNLIDALDLVIDHCATTQRQEDTAAIVSALQNSQTTPDLTFGQYTILLNTIRPLALDGPINTIINTIQNLQPLLLSGQDSSLTSTEIQTLQELLGFVCVLFENQTAAHITTLLTPLRQAINKQYNLLSNTEKNIYQKYGGFTGTEQAVLKGLATQLLANQINLVNLSSEQLQMLSNGFIFLATQKNSNFSPAVQSLFQEISSTLEKQIPLSVAQQNAFTIGLTYFKTTQLTTYTLAQAETDIYTLFNKEQIDAISDQFAEAKNKLEYVTNNSLTVQERLMLLVALQLTGLVLETRYAQHVTSAEKLSTVFGPEEQLKQQIYQQISYAQYNSFVTIYQALQNAQSNAGNFNTGTLTLDQRQDLYNFVALLVTPTKINASTITEGKIGLLQLLSDTYTKDPLIAPLFSLVTSATQPLVTAMYKLLRAYNFSFSQFTQEQKQLLLKIVTLYQKTVEQDPTLNTLKTASSQTESQAKQPAVHPLSIPEEMTLDTVLTLLHATTHAQTMQDSLKTSLGQYLNFFTPYTATLQTGTYQAANSTNNTNYQGLTQFSNYAQSIAQSLQGTAINNTNPPLFFYNAQTLQLINILPFLAQSVEGTMCAPFPTLAIQAATSTNPTAAQKNQNNQIISSNNEPVTVPSLTVTVGGVTYSPRFFFKDSNGNAYANGSDSSQSLLPSWIEKTTDNNLYVPAVTSDGQPIKPVGQEGLYMNIPMAHESAIAQGMATIRLYEQKILPQPEWLNSEAGVITMTRVCLGDFASALTLQDPLFDPCIELIFRQAVATLPTLPQGLPNGSSLDLSSTTLQNLSKSCQLSAIENYLDTKERAQAQEIMGTQSAQGNQ